MCKRVALITGGPIDDIASELLEQVDEVICADGGVDFALRNSIAFKEVFGDFDSITPGAKEYIDTHDIDIHTFPVEKDMTDTELALRTMSKEDDIVLICPLNGRIDHVVTNLNLIARLREEGYNITASDGLTDIIPLAGNDSISIPEVLNSDTLAVSLIPLTEEVTGVTTSGLYYECSDTSLKFGSSFSNSNKFKDGESGLKVSIKSGRLLVVITECV
ncbi:MAG: thiamine diphosphokinase [Clostridia bacterium]|nr:thiamine diphosphokinase [Clostridia bacterium]